MVDEDGREAVSVLRLNREPIQGDPFVASQCHSEVPGSAGNFSAVLLSSPDGAMYKATTKELWRLNVHLSAVFFRVRHACYVTCAAMETCQTQRCVTWFTGHFPGTRSSTAIAGTSGGERDVFAAGTLVDVATVSLRHP